MTWNKGTYIRHTSVARSRVRDEHGTTRSNSELLARKKAMQSQLLCNFYNYCWTYSTTLDWEGQPLVGTPNPTF